MPNNDRKPIPAEIDSVSLAMCSASSPPMAANGTFSTTISASLKLPNVL